MVQKYDSDEKAREVFNEFGENLAAFLTLWLKKFETESLIIGGNISKAYDLFSQRFKEELLNQGVDIKIGVSKLKEEAALIGSARLLDASYYKSIKLSLAKM